MHFEIFFTDTRSGLSFSLLAPTITSITTTGFVCGTSGRRRRRGWAQVKFRRLHEKERCPSTYGGEVRKGIKKGYAKMGFSGSSHSTIFQSESGFSRKHNASNRLHLDFSLPSSIYCNPIFHFRTFSLLSPFPPTSLISYVFRRTLFLVEYHSSITLSYITTWEKEGNWGHHPAL